MIWPFRNRTRVYICDTLRPGDGWQVCTVRYDPWGDPGVWFGEFMLRSWVPLKTGGIGGRYGFHNWKHASGPQVDFTRKFSTNPPISKDIRK